jgi:ubiquinone/menaquinone biosynthesis C-methylase UbiE
VSQVGSSGLVIGIDSSAAVLEVAQEVISAPNVRFVHARAEVIHEVLEQESIDLVLCNFAFWKCEPRATLHAINTLLKPDGKFLFNVVENYTRQQAQWQFPTAFQQVLLAVAREQGIPAPERKVSRLVLQPHLEMRQLQWLIAIVELYWQPSLRSLLYVTVPD